MNDPLSVSVDVSAIPQQAVGVGRFALGLVAMLARRDDVELTLWCRRDDSPRWVSANEVHGGSTSTSSATRVLALAPTSRPARLVWEQLRLPRLLSHSVAGLQVHHGLHYTMPEHTRVPVVVTVHDLTFFDHPEWHERAKVRVFRRAIRVASRRAVAVLCVSNRTAQRLEELCHPDARVFVVPHGVDLARFRPAPSSGSSVGTDVRTFTDPSAKDEAILEALSVREPYVLFLGTLEPRKAVPELVAAFDSIADRARELSLVLAGRPGWGAAQVERQVAMSRHADRVIRTGWVPDEAVPALLRKAAVVAYPAKEEGFGLPALEALACGAPLVTTAGTVMSDLAGAAALTAAPGSVNELAEALEAALSDGDAASKRRELGLEIAARYTWEASADAHVAAYRWAAEHARK